MKRSHTLPLFLLVLLLAATAVQAQTSARVTTVQATQGNTQARTTLHVLCNGLTYYGLESSKIVLTDNGRLVQQFSIGNSASAQTRKPFKAMLVLDVSGSMAGQGLDGLKTAATTLVRYMDPATDSLGIITFSSKPNLIRPYTADTADLIAAIRSFAATGATAVWDATYMGLEYTNAMNDTSSQAVVVMTDGGDNSSMRSPADLVALANRSNRRIFNIGLGTGVNGYQLDMISTLTGGMYFFAPNANDLSTIFLQIASFARRGFDEYHILYRTPDPDATSHEVVATVNLCDTIVSGSAVRPSIPATTAVDDVVAPVSARLDVLPLSPNPLRGTVLTCRYNVAAGASNEPVYIDVYDAAGRLCIPQAQVSGTPGRHAVPVHIGALSSGVYRVQVRLGGETRSVTAIIAR